MRKEKKKGILRCLEILMYGVVALPFNGGKHESTHGTEKEKETY